MLPFTKCSLRIKITKSRREPVLHKLSFVVLRLLAVYVFVRAVDDFSRLVPYSSFIRPYENLFEEEMAELMFSQFIFTSIAGLLNLALSLLIWFKAKAIAGMVVGGKRGEDEDIAESEKAADTPQVFAKQDVYGLIFTVVGSVLFVYALPELFSTAAILIKHPVIIHFPDQWIPFGIAVIKLLLSVFLVFFGRMWIRGSNGENKI